MSTASLHPDAARPIGVFDSGIGGLTVVRALQDCLPGEDILYFGDAARVPYGTKSPDTVIRFTRECVSFLAHRGIKLLVVACNTASAVALPALTRSLSVPVVGVIGPGVAAALRRSRGKRIGVIGTEGTVASGAYRRGLQEVGDGWAFFEAPCPLFVPLAEEGWITGEVPRLAAQRYLEPLLRENIDTLILGCTHYPLLREVIAETMGPSVTLIDSATATATAVREALERHGLARRRGQGTACFFVSDAPERFVKVGSRFLGAQVDSAVRIER